MNFGHIEIAALGEIKFDLKPEPEMNAAVLRSKPADSFRFNLGLSSWGRPRWVGKLYPPKVKEKDFLHYYAQHFNSIELNATHYKIYREAGIQNWKAKSNNPDFKFCPKMYKGVTHFGSLHKKEAVITEFLQGIKVFNEQSGGILVQLSDSFSPQRRGELDVLLDSLPNEFLFFLELRHPDWFTNPDIFEKLKSRNIGAVITDSAGRRDVVHMHLTVPKLFVRFVANDMHPSDTERIKDWAQRILFWKGKGLEEVNFFLHSYDDNEVLEVAKMAIDIFNEVCAAKLKPLKIGGNTLF